MKTVDAVVASRGRLSRVVALATGVAGLTLVGGASAHAEAPVFVPPTTVLVSSSATGVPGNRAADRPEISGNGRYITFDSSSTNLVPGVTTVGLRVYRKDLQTGEIVVVGQSDADVPTNAWSSFTWPDQTGNLVAFVSDATDLTAPSTVSRSVFLRNISAGTTELISIGNNGKASNGASSRPMLTRNGRFVAFSSFGSNITAAGGNGQEQVYLRDRLTNTTILVSKATDGTPGNSRSYRGMVSEDGRYVAYASSATNQVAGAQVNGESIFLRDTVAGTTTRISNLPGGKPGFGSRPYLSPDGRYVVFNSYSPLVASDTNGLSDVYTFDRTTGVMTRTSTTVSGGDGSDEALRGFISDDARFYVFNSFSSNLTDDDTNGKGDSFIRDASTGRTARLSVSFTGGGADAQSYRPVPSADGSVVTFLSEARNLVRNDTSTDFQVYAITSDSAYAVTRDATLPTATVTAPASGAYLVGTSVTLTGQFADDRAVDNGFVQVRDEASGYWLKPDGTWGPTATRVPVTLGNRFATSTSWTTTLALPAGRYRFEARSLDTAANLSASTGFTPFTLADQTSDTTAPTTVVSAPAANATVSTESVDLRGTFTDDRGVDRGFVQLRDDVSGLWLKADGTWAATATRLTVALASPGAPSTSWSLTVPLPVGRYRFETGSFDTSNNQSASSGFVAFAMVDTDPPTATVTAPVDGSTSAATSITLGGRFADNRSVASGSVQVQDEASGAYLRADGTWGPTTARVPVVLASPGAASTTWSLALTLPSGRYRVEAAAVDAGGTPSPASASVRFTLDSTAPAATLTSPTDGATLLTSAVTLSGDFSDSGGVDRGYVEVQDVSTSQWLNADGTWGPTATRLPVVLTAPGATSSGWSLGVTLPDGSYRADAVAFDSSGNPSPTTPVMAFTVTDLGADVAAPTARVATPAVGSTVSSTSVVVVGQVDDDRGVDRAYAQVQDVTTGLWLQTDTTWGAGVAQVPLALAAPAALSTTGSLSVPLPLGSYRVAVGAVDVSGHESPLSSYADFTVVDTTAPSVGTATPADGSVVTTPSVALSGLFTDDRGVDRGFLTLQDTASGLWRQADGTWAATPARLPVTLAAPGAPRTSWSLALPLPVGGYRFGVGAVDVNGNESGPRPSVSFTTADLTAPTAALTAPSEGAVVTGGSLEARGRLADDRGVDRGAVRLQDVASGQWLQPGGTWGTTPARLLVALSDRGATTTSWSLSLSLRPGRYRLDALGTDQSGNDSTPTGPVGFTVPDTTVPTAATTSPAAGSTAVGPAITLSGTATDDVGVTKTFVQVRNNTSLQWLKADGTWGATAVRLSAILGSPSATTTTWSLGVSLPAGSYGFDVQSQDAAGNVSTKPWTSFTVGTLAPPDTSVPTVAVTSPVNKATVDGPAVTFQGTGTDDVAVTKAFLQVRNNATNLWLRADGTWGSGAVRLAAVLTDVGGGSWGWSLATTLPAGSYGFDIELRDAANNSSAKPWTSFTVR